MRRSNAAMIEQLQPLKANMHCTEGCIVPQPFQCRYINPLTGHRCSSSSLSESSEASECERAESMEATVRYSRPP